MSSEFRYHFLIQKWWWADVRERIRLKIFGPRMLNPWFSVRDSLPLYLGNTLLHWADHAQSYDPNLSPSLEEWRDLLRYHGQTLLDFYNDDEETPETLKAAQDTLYWITDNLPTFWD